MNANATNAKQRKRLGLLALAAFVVVAVVYGFWPRPVAVETAEVRRGALEQTLEEEGRTRVKDRYVVAAPVAAYARRVELEVGDAVVRDQPLLVLEALRSDVLDPRRRAQAVAQTQAAEAALRAAEENARAAATEAARTAGDRQRLAALFEAGSATRHTLDAAVAAAQRTEAARQAAQAAIDVARYDLEAARSALSYGAAGARGEVVRLQAPTAGRVLRVHHQSEGVVGAGQPLLDVGDPQSLEVVVDVLSFDAVRIEPGMPVRFDRWGGGDPLGGVVRTVEPVGFTKVSALGVEEQRVLVVVDFAAPEAAWARLGDGYRVIAHFILWAGDDVLQVPASALFRHGDGWAVFVEEGGRARLRAVEVGARSGLAAQVLDGLDEGATVIVHPSDAVGNGVRVRPR